MLHFLLLLLVPTVLAGSSSCPQRCSCKTQGKVDCSRRGFTSIPSDIPATAVSIDLSLNNIAQVPDKAFAMAPNLEVVDLRHNSISSIGDNAFDGLQYLKRLFLIQNRLNDDIRWTSINTRPQLQELYLSHNLLTKIPPIQNAVVLSLVLDGNRITSAAFPKEIALSARLQSVVLSGNNIASLGSTDFANLAQLGIKSLDLKLNALSQIDPSAFNPVCNSLETLNLDHNRLDATMIKNVLTSLGSAHQVALLTLSLGYNSMTSLDKDLLSPLAKGMLRNLQLDGMAFSSVDPTVLQPVAKTLELLSLKEAGLSKPPLDFTALSALADLRLDGNQLNVIPPLPKSLQRLTISRNNIAGWSSSTFQNINLRGLDVSSNGIQFLSNQPNADNSLARFLNSLQLLNLYNDPFNCTCKNISWFQTWAKSKSNVVIKYNKYTCASPVDKMGHFLKDVKCESLNDAPNPLKVLIFVRGIGFLEYVSFICVLMLLFFGVVIYLRQSPSCRKEERPASEKERLIA